MRQQKETNMLISLFKAHFSRLQQVSTKDVSVQTSDGSSGNEKENSLAERLQVMLNQTDFRQSTDRATTDTTLDMFQTATSSTETAQLLTSEHLRAITDDRQPSAKPKVNSAAFLVSTQANPLHLSALHSIDKVLRQQIDKARHIAITTGRQLTDLPVDKAPLVQTTRSISGLQGNIYSEISITTPAITVGEFNENAIKTNPAVSVQLTDAEQVFDQSETMILTVIQQTLDQRVEGMLNMQLKKANEPGSAHGTPKPGLGLEHHHLHGARLSTEDVRAQIHMSNVGNTYIDIELKSNKLNVQIASDESMKAMINLDSINVLRESLILKYPHLQVNIAWQAIPPSVVDNALYAETPPSNSRERQDQQKQDREGGHHQPHNDIDDYLDDRADT